MAVFVCLNFLVATSPLSPASRPPPPNLTPTPPSPASGRERLLPGVGGGECLPRGGGGGLKKKGGEEEEEERKRSRQGEGELTEAIFADSGPAAGVREEWRPFPARYPGWCGRLRGRTTRARGFPWKVRAPGVASLLRQGLRVLGEVAVFAGRRWRQHGGSRGVPFPFGSESRRPTQEVSGDPHLSVFAWVSPTGGPSVAGPGFRPFPARLNSEAISSPSQFQVLVISTHSTIF